MIGAILGGILIVGLIVWGVIERFRVADSKEQPDNWNQHNGVP